MSPPSSYMFKFHLFVILYEKTTKQDRIYDRTRIFIIQSNMTLNLKFKPLSKGTAHPLPKGIL